MRVGYILEPPYPTFFVSEVEALRRAGAAVTVFNSFRPFGQPYPAAEQFRQQSHYFPSGYQGVAATALRTVLRRPLSLGRVARFAREHRLAARLVLLATHYARVVEQEGIEHLHAGYGTTPATLAMFVSWLSGRPFSFTLHAAYDMFLSNPLLELKAREAAFVTTVSDFNRDFLQRSYPTLEVTRLEVVRLGVELQDWPLRSTEPSNTAPVCVSVANLGPTKGHAVLLQALSLLRERGTSMRAVIVGDGELREELSALARSLGVLDRVEFLGHLPPPAVRAQLDGADVFVLPVVVAEDGNHDGLPVALMEAMARGVPVVSSRVAGIPELVQDQLTGLLVPPGDAVALAGCLDRLCHDPSARHRLAAAARALVVATYDRDRNARRMIELFIEASGHPSRSISTAPSP